MSLIGALSYFLPSFYTFSRPVQPKQTTLTVSNACSVQKTRSQKTSKPQQNFLNLPTEILLQIVELLPVTQKVRLKEVSRKALEIANAALWKPSWIKAKLFSNQTEVDRFIKLCRQNSRPPISIRKLYNAASSGKIRPWHPLSALDFLKKEASTRCVKELVAIGLIEPAQLEKLRLSAAQRTYLCSDQVVVALLEGFSAKYEDLEALPDEFIKYLPDNKRQIAVKQYLLTLAKKQNSEQAISTAAEKTAIEDHYAALREKFLQNPWIMQIYTTAWYTPLRCAIEEDDIFFMAAALNHGADIENYKSSNGSALLALAADNERLGIVQLLLSKNADPSHINKAGDAALHFAAYKGDSHIAQTLLQAYPKNVNQVNKAQYSALHLAALSGCCETVKVLLTYGADIDQLDAKKRNAYNLAASCGHIKVMRLLAKKRAELTKQDTDNAKIHNYKQHLVKNGYACHQKVSTQPSALAPRAHTQRIMIITAVA